MPALQDGIAWSTEFVSSHPVYSVALLILILPLLVGTATYSITWVQFYIGNLQDKGQRRKALVVPYSIPVLGSAISMATNIQKTLEYLATQPQARRPLCVKAGPQNIYLIFGPENLRQLFVAKETTQKERVTEIFRNLGFDQRNLDIVDSDNSGDQAKPKYDIDKDKRIFRNTAENFASCLMAPDATRRLAERFTEEMVKRYQNFSDKEAVTVSLFKLLKKEMVFASGIALHGEVLFEENPDFHEALWGFDEAFPNLLLRLPRWLVPKTYAQADRLRDALRRWYRAAIAQNDPSKPQDAHWDPFWGSRFWRRFVYNFTRTGIDIEDAATGSMTTLWATHGNSIPGSTWVLMEILTRPKLKADIIEELKTATISTSPPAFDQKTLLELPILNAVWDETLRLRVAVAVYRETQEDVYINETLIPKGSQMICMSVSHQSPELWKPFNGGSAKDYSELPYFKAGPRDFDPMRFLKAKQIKADRSAPKEERDRATAALSPYNYFPWGGGSHMCPGRYFAKQEVFYAVAMLLTAFDVEVLGWQTFDGKPSARPPKPNPARYGFGVQPPDRDLEIRMKRKEAW